MKIKRTIEGKEYEFELTKEEISAAGTEKELNWMRSEVEEIAMRWGATLTEEQLIEARDRAYEIYCDGENITEWDACEEAMSELMGE